MAVLDDNVQKKISLLQEKINLHRTYAHKQGRFSLFDAKFARDTFNNNKSYEHLKSLYEIIEDWDVACNLPYDVGYSLDRLATDYTVMIHRTNLGLNKNKPGLEYNKKLLSIMNNGLMNFGHANAISGGTSPYMTPLTLTMTPLKGITGYINLISSYKANDTIVIATFPKELVSEDGNLTSEFNYSYIYDLSDKIPIVKKEFLTGVILKKNNGFDEFYSRDKVINTIGNNLGSGNFDKNY